MAVETIAEGDIRKGKGSVNGRRADLHSNERIECTDCCFERSETQVLVWEHTKP